jgi:hypothetical protein
MKVCCAGPISRIMASDTQRNPHGPRVVLNDLYEKPMDSKDLMLSLVFDYGQQGKLWICFSSVCPVRIYADVSMIGDATRTLAKVYVNSGDFGLLSPVGDFCKRRSCGKFGDHLVSDNSLLDYRSLDRDGTLQKLIFSELGLQDIGLQQQQQRRRRRRIDPIEQV